MHNFLPAFPCPPVRLSVFVALPPNIQTEVCCLVAQSVKHPDGKEFRRHKLAEIGYRVAPALQPKHQHLAAEQSVIYLSFPHPVGPRGMAVTQWGGRWWHCPSASISNTHPAGLFLIFLFFFLLSQPSCIELLFLSPLPPADALVHVKEMGLEAAETCPREM